MGNEFAYLMLVIWPLLTVYWYRFHNIQTATLWTIIGSYMFLPVRTEVNINMFPALSKYTIPVISALFCCWLVKKRPISYFNRLGTTKYLLLIFIIVPFITASLNQDALIIGDTFIPGLSYYDGLSAMINQFLLVTPFFIGRQLFITYDHHLMMFKFLVAAGLLYSILMLIEIRLSPQLHTWVYGYFPHSFSQQIRQNGFRPVVFMGHGLAVAFFCCMVLVASLALWKKNIKLRRIAPASVSYYFVVVLILCKSSAAIIFSGFAWLVIKTMNTKFQHKIAVLLAITTLSYPLMSIFKIFPHETITNIATSISPLRSQSLQFRFDNENLLLEHGVERFYFGWGGWGRNRIYNEITGQNESVTDGRWIITFGVSGIFGFIAEFGLLALTIFKAYTASKLLKKNDDKVLLAAHSLMVGIVMINLLPNDSLTPWVWLFVGILLGRSEGVIRENMLRKRVPDAQ